MFNKKNRQIAVATHRNTELPVAGPVRITTNV